jgi:hypothetical protein
MMRRYAPRKLMGDWMTTRSDSRLATSMFPAGGPGHEHRQSPAWLLRRPGSGRRRLPGDGEAQLEHRLPVCAGIDNVTAHQVGQIARQVEAQPH